MRKTASVFEGGETLIIVFRISRYNTYTLDSRESTRVSHLALSQLERILLLLTFSHSAQGDYHLSWPNE